MQNIYPIEFLNQQKASGLPLAHLALKPGCPLMLLHNLDVTNSLCNRTQMILLSIKNCVLECHILGGKHAEKIVFIPRITIEPSSEELAIPLSHCQFPVHLTFCMTINKSQVNQSSTLVSTYASQSSPMASSMLLFPDALQQTESKSYSLCSTCTHSQEPSSKGIAFRGSV
jgi:ATP-dependent DNA helicase PIF1